MHVPALALLLAPVVLLTGVSAIPIPLPFSPATGYTPSLASSNAAPLPPLYGSGTRYLLDGPNPVRTGTTNLEHARKAIINGGDNLPPLYGSGTRFLLDRMMKSAKSLGHASAALQARSTADDAFGALPSIPSYLQKHPVWTKLNVYGEEVGYCMAAPLFNNAIRDAEKLLRAMNRAQARCEKEVTERWNKLSRMENAPNPRRHPQPRALDFQDVVHSPPGQEAETWKPMVFDLGKFTGYCAWNKRQEFLLANKEYRLTVVGWDERMNSFFDDYRKDIAQQWWPIARQGGRLPQAFIITPEPGRGPDLSWIPHPHGLGHLNFRGLAAAGAKVRQEAWQLEKKEGALWRGLKW
ncbi:MAG: hypothetical protein M1826_006995 [Phylliscum demangeonii]|nr:MAG: hypothetical protein M1826_006995 [Phylliscum demangeonii]